MRLREITVLDAMNVGTVIMKAVRPFRYPLHPTQYTKNSHVLQMSFFVVFGTGIRCVTMEPTPFLALSHLSQIFNGVSGIAAMSAPPLIAASWFPENERIFATSVSQVCNFSFF